MSNEHGVELGIEECWAMRRTAGPPFRTVEEVHITARTKRRPAVAARTAEGTLLLGRSGYAREARRHS